MNLHYMYIKKVCNQSKIMYRCMKGKKVEFSISKTVQEDGTTKEAAVYVTDVGETKLYSKAREGYYTSYAENKARAGGIYRKPSTYCDKNCGNYRGEYGQYGALMRNDVKPS